MSYNKDFKNIGQVCEQFDFDIQKSVFIKRKKVKIAKYCFERLNEFFNTNTSFSTETAICERLIFPVIYEIARLYELPVWSQATFNVDKKLKLVGTPDFIIAPAQKAAYDFKLPVVFLGEAKKNDFEKGWGQVGAEMLAAQIANIQKIKEELNKKEKVISNQEINKIKNIAIYGLVTDGKSWEFGKLEKKQFTIDKEPLKTPRELQKVFDTLNWMFCEARKNADKLLEMEKNK